MKFIKYFLLLLSVMYTVTSLTYAIFNNILQSQRTFEQGSIQSLGLALLFTCIISSLDYLSNFSKQLNNKYFPFIQYILLLITIVFWGLYFEWGDWSNYRYIAIFICSFTVIYLIVYFMIDTKYKKEDKDLSRLLKSYQDEIKL